MDGQGRSKEKSDKQDKNSGQTIQQEKTISSSEAALVTTQLVSEASHEQEKTISSSEAALVTTQLVSEASHEQEKTISSSEAALVTTQLVSEASHEQDEQISAELSTVLLEHIVATYERVGPNEVTDMKLRRCGGSIELSARVNAQKFKTEKYWNSRCMTDLTLTWNQETESGKMLAVLDFQVRYHDQGYVLIDYEPKTEETTFLAKDLSELAKSFVRSIQKTALHFEAHQNEMVTLEQLWLDNMEDQVKQRTKFLTEMAAAIERELDTVTRDKMKVRFEVLELSDKYDTERYKRTISLAELQSKLDQLSDTKEFENLKLELEKLSMTNELEKNSEDRCVALTILDKELDMMEGSEYLKGLHELESNRLQYQIEDMRARKEQEEWWMETPNDSTLTERNELIHGKEKRMISRRIIEQLKGLNLIEKVEKSTTTEIENFSKWISQKTTATTTTDIEEGMYLLERDIITQMEPEMNEYLRNIHKNRMAEVEESMAQVTERVETRIGEHICNVLSKLRRAATDIQKQIEEKTEKVNMQDLYQKQLEKKRRETEMMKMQLQTKNLHEVGYNDMMREIEKDNNLSQSQTPAMKKRISSLHHMEVTMTQEINRIELSMIDDEIYRKKMMMMEDGVKMTEELKEKLKEEMDEWILATIKRAEEKMRCTMAIGSDSTIKMEMHQIKFQMLQTMKLSIRKQMEKLLGVKIQQIIKPGQDKLKINDMVTAHSITELLHMLVSPELLTNKLKGIHAVLAVLELKEV